MKELNKHSKTITQDESQPASQAMLYAVGLKEEDMAKAQVGIVSTGYEGNPCNMHLNGLSELIKNSVNDVNLVGLIFHTIGVSDGISNGTEGMKYSLVSRDIIADSIETVANAQFYDALVPVVGCDKNMPGAMIALARLNRPGILVYGGTIKAGKWKGEDLNIVSAFEAYGAKLAGNISDEDYKEKGTHIKWNPAVKTSEDRKGLWEALLDDRIDIIASDHAPHTLEEKSNLSSV